MQIVAYESVQDLCRAAARGLAAAPAALHTLQCRHSGMRWLRECGLGQLELTMWTLAADWRSEWPAQAAAACARSGGTAAAKTLLLVHLREAR